VRCALLVEQHAAFRQAMAYLLSRDLRFELVEEAATLSEARALALENLGRSSRPSRSSAARRIARPHPPDRGRDPRNFASRGFSEVRR
jgi:sugar (pentulose or hexulose) kinase